MNELQKLIKKIEQIDEAYDDTIDPDGQLGLSADAILRGLIAELQKLERNTARVFAEAQQSSRRPDYAEMLLNELSMTLTDISDLVEKYEDF